MDAANLITDWARAWNERDDAAFAARCDEDVEITSPGGVQLHGADGIRQFWAVYQDAFPDNRIVLGAVYGTGEHGTQEAVFEGTHTGVLHAPDGSEIPPTGRRVSVPFVGLHTFRDGRIVSYRLYFDQTGLLTQLGLVPETAV